MKYYFSIPCSIDLKKEKAWRCTDTWKTVYFVSRLHFMAESFQVDEPHKIGEKLAVYQSPKDASLELTGTEEFSIENINIIETLQKSLHESNQVEKFGCGLASKLRGYGVAGISSYIKGELVSEFKESFSTSFRVKDSSIVKKSTTFCIKNTLGATLDKPLIAVPVYQRRGLNIYLSYIDYIHVKYEKKFFGLRKKRQCYPRVSGPDPENKFFFGLPLVRVLYWKHLEKSSKIVCEEEYMLQVDDPHEVTITPFDKTTTRGIDFPKIPTLYQIVRVAFPTKWKDKKFRNYTEEELLKIEYEEAKYTPWWYRHGPGRDCK